MLDNPSDPSSVLTPVAAAAAAAATKRHAPSFQRNRVLNRRKSGERFERTNNIYGNEEEKSQLSALRNVPAVDDKDAGSSNLMNDNPRSELIALDGCCSSEAFRLLNDRWAATMKCYDDPSIDLTERPVICSGSGASAWGQFRLPHQMDFLGELRRAMRNANSEA
ncbi:uncharacterized protein LOC131148514 isoform X2 [Malania oleifera]|uniref:uncharacterized protein LOC131148514 isoform X2 n=1 Tax=Malania oleifera TaxID=397392 RepID=UPI0025AE8F0F|nr:uncharacterized protein LOC131148514 isoform X2 [Malania oleifera]